MTLTFAVYLLLSLVFLSLTLSVFYDIPQFSKYHTLLKLLWCHVPMNQSVISGSFSDLGLHLNKHRDIYLDEEQNSTSDSGHKKTDFKPKRFLCFKRQPSNASNEWKVLIAFYYPFRLLFAMPPEISNRREQFWYFCSKYLTVFCRV